MAPQDPEIFTIDGLADRIISEAETLDQPFRRQITDAANLIRAVCRLTEYPEDESTKFAIARLRKAIAG
jgi:hypothetical protein